jgi:hypothetical protein
MWVDGRKKEITDSTDFTYPEEPPAATGAVAVVEIVRRCHCASSSALVITGGQPSLGVQIKNWCQGLTIIGGANPSPHRCNATTVPRHQSCSRPTLRALHL